MLQFLLYLMLHSSYLTYRKFRAISKVRAPKTIGRFLYTEHFLHV